MSGGVGINLIEFLKPTRNKIILTIAFVGIEWWVRRYCWDLPVPIRCPPGISVFLREFGGLGYIFFYLAACVVMYANELMRRDRV
jgi:hypothetical protein